MDNDSEVRDIVNFVDGEGGVFVERAGAVASALAWSKAWVPYVF
jgi:hypothetical protein